MLFVILCVRARCWFGRYHLPSTIQYLEDSLSLCMSAIRATFGWKTRNMNYVFFAALGVVPNQIHNIHMYITYIFIERDKVSLFAICFVVLCMSSICKSWLGRLLMFSLERASLPKLIHMVLFCILSLGECVCMCFPVVSVTQTAVSSCRLSPVFAIALISINTYACCVPFAIMFLFLPTLSSPHPISLSLLLSILVVPSFKVK